MATLRTRRLTFTVLGLLGAAAPLSAAAEGEGLLASFARELGLAKDPTAPHPCTLAELRENPEAYRGVRVTLMLQMHERGQFWNPFFTRFAPENYVNFSAWGDEQRLWVASEYESDFPLLFVERRSEMARTILAAATYQRFQATAIVRDTFRGMPWIEVTKLSSLSDRITRGTLVHGARGRKWMDARKWTLAANEFDRAITDDLPDAARVGLLKDLSVCHYARGDRERTRTVLLAAAELNPKDAEVNAALESLLLEEEKPLPVEEPAPQAKEPAPQAEPPKKEEEAGKGTSNEGGATSDTGSGQGNSTDTPPRSDRGPDGK
ncbi:MAG TPA: hypothetical protein VFI25_09985 [Planctomycetota bacterium]|nr:hypothetical protein [Planctomycetota bacterium]